MGRWVFGLVVYGFVGRRMFASLGSLGLWISCFFFYHIERKFPLSLRFIHLLITLQWNATIKELQSKANMYTQYSA